MRYLRTILPCALLIATFAAVGCGGGAKLTPVEGKVTLAGKSADYLKGGVVTFHPDTDAGNKQTYAQFPMGTIDETGKYTLSTGGKPGAPVGAYKVTVRVEKQQATDPNKPSYAPPVYLTDSANADVTTTNLKKEVKADAPAGHYDIPLTK